MIFEAIFLAIQWALQSIFSLLPDLPDAPAFLTTGADFVSTLVGQGVGLVSFVYGTELTIFIFTATIAILNFENFYKLTMFIWRKLPFGSS